MSAELGRIGAVEIPAAEIASRKAVLIGAFGRDVETTGGLAGQISSLAQFGLPLSKLQTYAADIDAVTPAQAMMAGRKHLDPATASLVVVGDAKVFGSKLKSQIPQVQTIAIDRLDLDSATLR